MGNNPVVHPLRGIYVARPGLEFHFTATGPSLPPGDFFAVQKSADTAQFWETPCSMCNQPNILFRRPLIR